MSEEALLEQIAELSPDLQKIFIDFVNQRYEASQGLFWCGVGRLRAARDWFFDEREVVVKERKYLDFEMDWELREAIERMIVLFKIENPNGEVDERELGAIIEMTLAQKQAFINAMNDRYEAYLKSLSLFWRGAMTLRDRAVRAYCKGGEESGKWVSFFKEKIGAAYEGGRARVSESRIARGFSFIDDKLGVVDRMVYSIGSRAADVVNRTFYNTGMNVLWVTKKVSPFIIPVIAELFLIDEFEQFRDRILGKKGNNERRLGQRIKKIIERRDDKRIIVRVVETAWSERAILRMDNLLGCAEKNLSKKIVQRVIEGVERVVDSILNSILNWLRKDIYETLELNFYKELFFHLDKVTELDFFKRVTKFTKVLRLLRSHQLLVKLFEFFVSFFFVYQLEPIFRRYMNFEISSLLIGAIVSCFLMMLKWERINVRLGVVDFLLKGPLSVRSVSTRAIVDTIFGRSDSLSGRFGLYSFRRYLAFLFVQILVHMGLIAWLEDKKIVKPVDKQQALEDLVSRLKDQGILEGKDLLVVRTLLDQGELLAVQELLEKSVMNQVNKQKLLMENSKS